MTWWIGVQAAIAASAAAIIVAIIYNYVWCTEEKDPKTRIEILWWSTLPWVPYIFSVFVAADLPCEGNRISGIALLRTFGSAGSISAVNALTMFALVEALVICRRRWKMKSQWGAFAVAFTGVILFWTWHLFVLVWVEDYLLPSYLGLYIALHATTLVLALGLGFAAGYKSTIVSFPKHAVGSGEKNKWCKSPEFWWSIVLTAGVVAGVIFLGSSTESVLVSIIGELPVISTITTAWVYKNNPEALDDIRCWVHSIQLFYKSCPFFLLLSCAFLYAMPTCGDWGTQFWQSILTQAVNFGSVVVVYGWWAKHFVLEQVTDTDSNPPLCKPDPAASSLRLRTPISLEF